MREADIIYTTKQVLITMARGGLRTSLFTDPAEDDAEVIMHGVLKQVPKSQKHIVTKAVEEWRKAHVWLANLPDTLENIQVKPEDLTDGS